MEGTRNAPPRYFISSRVWRLLCLTKRSHPRQERREIIETVDRERSFVCARTKGAFPRGRRDSGKFTLIKIVLITAREWNSCAAQIVSRQRALKPPAGRAKEKHVRAPSNPVSFTIRAFRPRSLTFHV